MEYIPIINLRGQSFPFGIVQDETLLKYKKIQVRKRIFYKNQHQYQVIQQKIKILKGISYPNIISIKLIEQTQRGYIDVFYGYVHHCLKNITVDKHFNIKSLHEQLIKMVVHAAKNSIVISFNRQKCGLKHVNGQNIIKYYFPIDQITICEDIKTVERSVQLFTVQSMQFLDELIFGMDQRKKLESLSNRRLSFEIANTNLFQKIQQTSGNICSERTWRHSVHLPPNLSQSHRNHGKSFQTITSTKCTIKDHISNSKSGQKSPNEYVSSLQKYLARKQQLKQRIVKAKQRSRRALQKLNRIMQEIQKSTKQKCRQSVKDFQSLKRFSLDQQIRAMIQKFQY